MRATIRDSPRFSAAVSPQDRLAKIPQRFAFPSPSAHVRASVFRPRSRSQIGRARDHFERENKRNDTAANDNSDDDDDALCRGFGISRIRSHSAFFSLLLADVDGESGSRPVAFPTRVNFLSLSPYFSPGAVTRRWCARGIER